MEKLNTVIRFKSYILLLFFFALLVYLLGQPLPLSSEAFPSIQNIMLFDNTTIASRAQQVFLFSYPADPYSSPNETAIGPSFFLERGYISPDGRWYYFFPNDHTLQLWDVSNPTFFQEIHLQGPPELGYRPDILSWSPDGSGMIVGYWAYKAGCAGEMSVVVLADGIWQISFSLNLSGENPYGYFDWTPNGQYITAYTQPETGSGTLNFYVFDRQGNVVHEFHNPSFTGSQYILYGPYISYDNFPIPTYQFFDQDKLFAIIYSGNCHHNDDCSVLFSIFDNDLENWVEIIHVDENYHILGVSPDNRYIFLGQDRHYYDHSGSTNYLVVNIQTGMIVQDFRIEGYCSTAYTSSDFTTIALTIYENMTNYFMIWYWDTQTLEDYGEISSIGWQIGWQDNVNGYVVKTHLLDEWRYYSIQP